MKNTEVTTLGRNDTLKLAQDIMNLGRVRHFPVLDDAELVGIVTETDMLQLVADMN
jgi:CBS domain-containing protein